MAIKKSLTNYLDAKKIKYEIVPHKSVFTAYDLAQTLRHDLDKIVKTLLIKVDLPQVKTKGKYYVLAMPASYRADFNKVKKALKASKVGIATEKAIAELKIEPGTLSPFVGFHKLELLLDKALLKTKDAIVRAGSLTESLRVKVKDLEKMEKALLGSFGKKVPGLKLQAKTKKPHVSRRKNRKIRRSA